MSPTERQKRGQWQTLEESHALSSTLVTQPGRTPHKRNEVFVVRLLVTRSFRGKEQAESS